MRQPLVARELPAIAEFALRHWQRIERPVLRVLQSIERHDRSLDNLFGF
jgi:hypothetical protein